VLAEASLWLRCTRSFTILSTARQPIAESSKPESITEGMEMSIHVNYELLTLLVTVLVSPLTSLPEGSLSEKAILHQARTWRPFSDQNQHPLVQEAGNLEASPAIIGNSRVQSRFRRIVVGSAVREARHRSALIRPVYCTELHPGFPVPEPLRFFFAPGSSL